MNQSIHTIDLMLHLMGDVKAVSASGGLEAHQGIEVEDIAVAIVEFKIRCEGSNPSFHRLLFEQWTARIDSYMRGPRLDHDGG